MSTWDVIVVGAGSAGAAFAGRSVEAGRRVLLLEAGRDLRSADLPAEYRPDESRAWVYASSVDDFTWPGFTTRRVRGREPERFFRGRALGGSSTINNIIAIRPPVEDFDDWAADGCAGWSHDDVLPFLRRLEDDAQFGAEPYHGRGGPVPITRLPRDEWGPVDHALREASLLRGFGEADDVNAPGATGISPYPMNARDGRRVTTNDGYLEPLRDSDLLEIRGDAVVDRVLFAATRAVGVVLADGTELRAPEVVLSGGVIGSATILQRSGVGPRELLDRLGIPVLLDLPVGRDMSDHVVSSVDVAIRPEFQSPLESRPFNCCLRYDSGLPDLPNDMLMIAVNWGGLFWQSSARPEDHGGLWVWVNRAFSRGSVEIVSRDPVAPPSIDHNLLSDPRDLARLRDGVRLAAELTRSPAFARICSGDPRDVNPELAAALDGTDDDLDAYLRATAIDTNHTTSTCRMGAVDDPRTVVGPDCRVVGTEGLSVVDASVLPFSPRANTHLVSVMVGEVAAERFRPSR